MAGNRLRHAVQGAPFAWAEGDNALAREQRLPGPQGLGDTSGGRAARLWRVWLEGTGAQCRICLAPAEATLPLWTLPAPQALAVSAAFDHNARPVASWLTGEGAHLHYYSTLAQAWGTRQEPGADSCRVCTDDVRDATQTGADAVWAYTRGGRLYWRVQRERYETAHDAGPCRGRIVRMGLSEGLRLQLELGRDAPWDAPPGGTP